MKPNMTNLVPGAVIVIMFAVTIFLVWDYPLLANRFLLMMGTIGILLGSILVLREIIPREKQDSPEKAEENRYRVPGKRLLITAAWVISLLPAVYLLGFTASASLYCFIFYKLHGGRWLPSIMLGLAIGILVYVVFIMVLHVRFPMPVLLPFFRW